MAFEFFFKKSGITFAHLVRQYSLI